MYQALYRKYRSQTFGEMVGQKVISTTLRQAVESGKISHAYLFSGPRGTGKTSAAKMPTSAPSSPRRKLAMPSSADPQIGEVTTRTMIIMIRLVLSMPENKPEDRLQVDWFAPEALLWLALPFVYPVFDC